MADPHPDVDTSALDALVDLHRADARLTRLEAQLEAVEGAVSALRELIAEEAVARRRLIDEHRDQLEVEARGEHEALRARLDAVRVDYDRLATGLDEQLQRHADKTLDAAAFTAAQRQSAEALRAKAAELASLDQLRIRFEETLGVPAAPVAAAPVAAAPVAAAPVAPPPPATVSAPAQPPAPPPPPAPALAPPPPTAAVPVALAAPTSPTPLPAMAPEPLAGVPFPPPLPTPIPLAPDASSLPSAVLVEAHEASSGAAHAVHDGLQIGRAIENELRVLDPSVSRQHAAIVVRSGAFVLEDLHSQNGTFVNGERIRQRVLCDGDRIAIGEAAFIFRTSPESADPDAAPAP